MVQVGDHVDVLCTLSNAAMSPGWTGTAVIAKSLRVVARFGTTRTAGQPPPGDLRSYTLESSPYRHAMLELAKSVGATFTLSVAARPPDDNAAGVVNQGDFGMDDPQVDRVSTADLAKLMGIVPQTDPKVWIIERMSGVEHQQPLYYEGYEPNNGKGNAGAKPSLPVIPSTGEPKKPAGTPLGGQPFAPPPNTQPTPTSKNNRSVPISSRARSSGMLLASSSSAPGSVYEGFSAPIGLQKPC